MNNLGSDHLRLPNKVPRIFVFTSLARSAPSLDEFSLNTELPGNCAITKYQYERCLAEVHVLPRCFSIAAYTTICESVQYLIPNHSPPAHHLVRLHHLFLDRNAREPRGPRNSSLKLEKII